MAVSVEGLAPTLKGKVVEPADADYDASRAVYNGMIDKRPAAIAYCADEADVAAALRYGVEHGLRIAVRGGGHNGGGLGSVDDGLVIDLSQMNAIEVDAPAKLARVGGGALLKDVLDATHQHGLSVPVGIIGTTGVGGLTLGGGVGHLTLCSWACLFVILLFGFRILSSGTLRSSLWLVTGTRAADSRPSATLAHFTLDRRSPRSS